jgi:hypothetical protein
VCSEIDTNKSLFVLTLIQIIFVGSDIHTKHIRTLCGENVDLFNVKPGGT